MFASAELGQTVDDATYAREVDKLRGDLVDAQTKLLAGKAFPVVVLVNGVDGAGKGESVNALNEWLDPRHVRSHAFGEPTEDERMRPPMWRFWRVLPPKGKVGILFGNWYTDPILERAYGTKKHTHLALAIERIRSFEKMLVEEGAALVKLWFHLSKKGQKKRLEDLESDKVTRWRVTKDDWKRWDAYDSFARVSEHVLRETSTGEAPWVVIDGTDPNYRALTAGKAVLAAITSRLAVEQASVKAKKTARKNGSSAVTSSAMMQTVDSSGILANLPFEERLSKEKYEVKVRKAQNALGKVARSPAVKKHGVVIVFEGMDAAGKGGAIRRITQSLDARFYNVVPIAAPTEEERAQPYLWRFWRHLPRHGQFVIFDRSWYGRVLVERVEGFASESAWMRAYREINEFEEQLADSGTAVVKFWLAITKEEQMKRFKERERIRHKQFKITAEDWRNRKKWDDYVTAASDMIDRTSTAPAPWTILEANDKHLARVRAIETLTKRLQAL